MLFLGNSPIIWSSKKQPTVSRSSTEAEYRALASCVAKLCWIRMLLKDFGVFLHSPPALWCDNIFAFAIASNPVFHARTKNIEVDYHFVCEKVLYNDLQVKFVSFHDQLVDILTKGLPSPWFHWLVAKLMWCFPMILRGDEEQSSISQSSDKPKSSDKPQSSDKP